MTITRVCELPLQGMVLVMRIQLLFIDQLFDHGAQFLYIADALR